MRRALAYSLALCFSLPVAPAVADHVTSSPQVSARLGERLSDNSWVVVVDWSINCSGPAPGNALYTGSLNLDDVDSGEVIYMGGTSSASGSDRQPVTRRDLPRRMRPRIKASCFDSGLGNHGSDTLEVAGNTVTVPGKGDENGDGVPDGNPDGESGSLPGGAGDQGRKDFPGAGFGGPTDPLRSGACARARLGTTRAGSSTARLRPSSSSGWAGAT